VKKGKVNAAELELVLKDLVGTEGVSAGVVVTTGGIMVDFLNKHTPEAGLPLPSVVAMMAITAAKCTRLFKKGEMKEIITKAERGDILTEKCGEFIILVAADKGFDFDSITPKRDKVKEVIRGMM
jgi:predicted regulator of Ras-like GTPase activity (Roadblock/LC7/MglB family)